MYIGSFVTADTVHFHFNTWDSTGAPITLAGTPSLTAYKDGSLTQDAGDITLTVDFDSVTGLHHVAIDTSVDATFYSADSEFSIVIAAGTVDGVSVVGRVVAKFSLNDGTLPDGAITSGALSAAGLAAIQAELEENGASLIDTINDKLGTPAADVSADIAAVKVDTAATLVDTGTTLDGKIDQVIAAVITNAAGADVAADIIALDAVADAIKVITDQITFTVTNQVDANVQSVNEVTITGDGSGTPFGV